MRSDRRVVVTGLGVVACNGIGAKAFWEANAAGRSGISLVTGFDTSRLGTKIAGVVTGFDPETYMPRDISKRVDRFVHFGLAAAEMAVGASGLDVAREASERMGVLVGSGQGGQLFHEAVIANALRRGAHRTHPAAVPRVTPNAVAAQIAIRYGCAGPNLVISTACASGVHAIGEAYRKIKYGDMDVCLTGGVEAPISEFSLGAYGALHVLSTRNEPPVAASRPFDRDRDGFVMGEGGGILVLEERERAIKRGAPLLAEIAGYGCNSGASHMVMPDATGSDAARAMRAAMAEAGVNRVDCINAHATATKANDVAETRAIKAVFGAEARSIPISATKSMVGHAIGGSGGIEAVACVLMLEHQFIPPTINLENPDADCDLDYVPNIGRAARIDSVLKNAFGFGNCNASLLFVRT